ncbi:type I secretion system permease/ATPase [Nitrincola tibetensis]|uniref:Type I secretion system permease/ATPase n=1 Tax=Nitrincola tibetensis TaxID=2219697 RepID=A0A364NN04_9GAMM|nr:type I secretion system permease/ATPase [Nitrincola tibetensis]RAU18414.1 type I secretion system permease/ATPase [Nitrincola tibetensis]
MREKQTELDSAIQRCRSSFIHVGVFSLCINLLMLVPALYMLQVYDRVIASGSESTLLMLTLIMVVLLTTMGILEWVRSSIMQKVSNRLNHQLSPKMFNVSYRQALYSGGTLVSSQPLKDLNGIRQFLSSNGLFAFFDSPWVPVYIFILYLFHPWLGSMALASVIVLTGLAVINEKVTQAAQAAANKELTQAASSVSKNLHNAEVIESMGMLSHIRNRWSIKNKSAQAFQILANERAAVLSSISKTFRIVIQSLVLGLGAYLALQQAISPGMMIAGSILLGRALAPIDQMIGVWKQFITVREQYARLRDTIESDIGPHEQMSLPEPVGEITAENAVICAPGSRVPILKGLSFYVAPGDMIGVIGPSAAGKSTFARALLGIWPALSGKIRLDGADIFTWDREQLGPHIGYLPQDIELFEGTISDNIARFGKADPKEVVTAARLAGVHDMILRLPDGYDTYISAQGGTLSGGQRQRIGLARALYGKPKFVVLDEPNSNLDHQGEAALAQTLKYLKRIHATVFIITHRTNVLSLVDKLMVLNQGTLTLYGPRDRVIAELNKANAGQISQQNSPTTSDTKEAE